MKNRNAILSFLLLFIISFGLLSCKATVLTVTAPEKSEFTKTVNIQTITTTTAPEPSGYATSEHLSSRKIITAAPQKSSTTTEQESSKTTTTKIPERKTTAPESYNLSGTPQVKFTGQTVLISAAEYNLICSIVMRETGAGSYASCVAVAQCFKDDMIESGENAYGVRDSYGYEGNMPTPNEKVKQAVYDVFYRGAVVTDEMIIAYYNPYITNERWHERHLTFVLEFEGHRYFKR